MANKSYSILSLYNPETVYVNSDKFFNNPDSFQFFGDNVEPVDVFGGFVPQNKDMSNLKKTEEAIQKRFGLEAGGESE